MNIAFSWRTLRFDHVKILLQVFADANREFDRHFASEANSLAAPEPPLYGSLWPAAEGLAQHLWERRDLLAGQRVLELGCGLGLPSLICAKAGAEVVTIDHHPDYAELFRANCQRNGLEGRAVPLIGSFTDPHLDLGRFSLIIGSDILYDPSIYRDLEAFVLRHSRAENSALILADPGRFAVAQFGQEIAACSHFNIHYQRVSQHPHAIEIRTFSWSKGKALSEAI